MTNTALILAAGKGTRLYPFSHDIPKPLLPLVNKSIIEHIIERLLKAGISKIGIVIKKSDKIIPLKIRTTFPELNSFFINQREALGTANAVLQAENYLSTESFLVIAGDSIFSHSYIQNLIKTHLKENNMITLSLERMEFDKMKESSTVDYRNGRILEVLEKPQTPEEVLSELNSAALYIFSKSIFNTLKSIKKTNRKEYELATAINKSIKHGQRVGGLITKRVCHISTSYDLWYFNLKFLHEIYKEQVNGNIIGKNTFIDSSAIIQNSILGDNVKIIKKVKIKNSVILSDTIIDRSYENSLVKSDYYECFTDKLAG